MAAPPSIPANHGQLLPTEAYTSQQWFEREQRLLFGKTWTIAGVVTDFTEPGDYITLRVGNHPLFVIKDDSGTLRAYHNLCRHRGTELLEGRGNTSNAIVCPYHRWVYRLDGCLRGMPGRMECFPQLELSEYGLHRASVRVFQDVVFVHPEPEPQESFENWTGPLNACAWPHQMSDLVGGEPIVYEMQCNWKIYFENAVDGYHLAYLHENTLGGPLPWQNVWDVHGKHQVWYSTEGDGSKRSMTAHMTGNAESREFPKVEGAEDSSFGGVYMLFPTSIVSPKPYGIYVSRIIPLAAEVTLLESRKWNLEGNPDDWAANEWGAALEARDERTGRVKLELLEKHPLDTGAFRLEDIWICEEIQRNMHSPLFEVGALAAGPGAETPIVHFQQCILDALSDAE